MTGQSLLDRMEVLNAELQLQAGEANVAKGLIALNMAQDFFESLAAARPGILGSTTGTVTTSASTEYTAFPTGLLRLDRLQLLNATTSRPQAELIRIQRIGGHAATTTWPVNLILPASSGAPSGYETSGGVIWWSPLPDATYTLRWYGFQAASDITASGTFAYPDIAATAIAATAVKLIKQGIDDPTQDIAGVVTEILKPCLDAMSNFNRDGSTALEYTQVHTT